MKTGLKDLQYQIRISQQTEQIPSKNRIDYSSSTPHRSVSKVFKFTDAKQIISISGCSIQGKSSKAQRSLNQHSLHHSLMLFSQGNSNNQILWSQAKSEESLLIDGIKQQQNKADRKIGLDIDENVHATRGVSFKGLSQGGYLTIIKRKQDTINQLRSTINTIASDIQLKFTQQIKEISNKVQIMNKKLQIIEHCCQNLQSKLGLQKYVDESKLGSCGQAKSQRTAKLMAPSLKDLQMTYSTIKQELQYQHRNMQSDLAQLKELFRQNQLTMSLIFVQKYQRLYDCYDSKICQNEQLMSKLLDLKDELLKSQKNRLLHSEKIGYLSKRIMANEQEISDLRIKYNMLLSQNNSLQKQNLLRDKSKLLQKYNYLQQNISLKVLDKRHYQ